MISWTCRAHFEQTSQLRSDASSCTQLLALSSIPYWPAAGRAFNTRLERVILRLLGRPQPVTESLSFTLIFTQDREVLRSSSLQSHLQSESLVCRQGVMA